MFLGIREKVHWEQMGWQIVITKANSRGGLKLPLSLKLFLNIFKTIHAAVLKFFLILIYFS